ncbi:Mg/Co/Ni transporter MgtE [Methanonatronarchaeum thermophilum]|uniref:Magnesium transporter MgtE n=1 Tax=Methanonatronarchaeum thermophilum TaxID=1927129 RepID=A0A1Y3GG53_9EURY|nr:magnesium transporter [Methanonatronarchaeum thermophilum]OUJ18356.1 Mg/Co/Ni transporter MgtE [Methanonatronarchaeum thermophilum]
MISPIEKDYEEPTDAADYDISVGEVMTQEYVHVTEGTSVGEAIKKFRDYTPEDPEKSTIYYTYVVDDEKHLKGVCSLRKMLNTSPEKPISEIMETELLSFHVDADAEEAAVDVSEIHFPAVPVTDNEGRLIGIVRSERLIEVVQETVTEDLLKLQGMDLPETTDFTEIETKRSTLMLDAPIHKILRIRIPWLVVALIGGFLAGGVIGIFEETLETVVLLAIFIPVIMDMGGNVGTQSSTIFVRGVVLGHIDKTNVWKRVIKEAITGLLIGILIGGIAALGAYLWMQRTDLAIVVFGSMIGTSIVAALVGFVIPWILYLAGQDPAAASNPLITTIKDVSGLLIYFGLASLLMAELL